LENPARQLNPAHPSAAAFLREELDDTITVIHLHPPECLAACCRPPIWIENLLSRVRGVAREVKRWHGGTMALKRAASGVLEAERRVRKVADHRALPKIVPALDTFVPVVNLLFAIDHATMRS
jgi:hypothetical protein